LRRNKQESVVRENRMLRSTWRGLETWFGRKLINTGAPVPDPT